jgi:hypothetical protein
MYHERAAQALLILIMVPLFLRSQELNTAPATSPHIAMSFGGTLDIEGDIALVNGAVGPNGFFKNLRSIESAAGKIFVNESGRTQFFPERLTVRVYISGPVPLTEKRRKSPAALDSHFMKGLKFKAHWKHGMDLRPVKELRLVTASEQDISPRGDRWIYDLVIEDSKVPLDDHLILEISSFDDKRLARLSAYI